MERSSRDSQTLYEILGVDRDADPTEVRDAYIKRIRAVHPDANPGHEEQAKRVNAAYDILCDPRKRLLYDQSLTTSGCPICGEVFDADDDLREHMDEHLDSRERGDGCQICGRAPSAVFNFDGNRGFVFFRQVFGFNGQLCRVCAKGVFRHVQTRNLSWGWFGFISFIATIGYALGNVGNYYSVRRGLASPSPSDRMADKRLGGRPVVLGVLVRLGGLAAFIAVVVLIVWLATGAGGNDSMEYASPTTITQAPTYPGDYVYLNRLESVAQARNDVIETSNARLLQWEAGPRQQPPGTADLVVNEIGSLKAKIDALPSSSSQLLSVHEAWKTSVAQLFAAESTLASSYSEANNLADNLAWTQENAAFGALLDYINAHY